MKEPVDHILRPKLPWRSESSITECGYDSTKVKTLTREEFFQRLKDFGEQRTAILTCMTCVNTARRWKTWEENPMDAVSREIQWENPRLRNRSHKMKNDLIAIELIINAHKEEFEKYLERQKWLERKLFNKQ